MNIDAAILSAAADEASEFLKSLASPVRLRILCSIAEKEASVGELAGLLGVRQSVASQHLALLRKDGLVMSRRDGQTIYYSLADDRVIKVIHVLQQAFCPTPALPTRSGAGGEPPEAKSLAAVRLTAGRVPGAMVRRLPPDAKGSRWRETASPMRP